MPTKKTINSPKAPKAAAKRGANPAGKRSSAATKPSKKPLVKQSTLKKASATRKASRNKQNAAVKTSVKNPATGKAPKTVSTKPGALRAQKATGSKSARTTRHPGLRRKLQSGPSGSSVPDISEAKSPDSR
jgi:hypothetical protein